MKLPYSIASRLILFVVALGCCIAALTPPAQAAEQPHSGYKICIGLIFSDGIVEGYEDYENTRFVIQDSDMNYLQAGYDFTTDAYIVCGYTNNADEATQFHFSKIDGSFWQYSTSGQLLITSLSAGSYTFTNVQVSTDYTLLEESIIVDISETIASVDGHIVEDYDGQVLKFIISVTKPLKLPQLEYFDPAQQIVATIGTSVGALLSYILIRCLYPDSEKSQE